MADVLTNPAKPWGFILFVFSLSVLTTALLAPLVQALGARFHLTDRPDTRKQHQKPVVRIGGIAMVLGFAVALTTAWGLGAFAMLPRHQETLIWTAICGSLGFFAIGLADDLLSLPPLPRLSIQLLVAALVWGTGIRINAVNLNLGEQVLQFSTGLSLLVTVLWLVGMTNAINWIDGLDGLAAGVSGIAAVGLTVVTFYVNDQVALAPTLLASALAGACLGFLRHNFSPARIFMGDGGSYFLGFALASISIIGPAKEFTGVSILLPLLILSLPLADMSAVIMDRLRSGRSPFYPDRRHLHHRLLRAGLSQRHTVLLIYAISQWLACLALVMANVGNRFLWLSLATAMFIWLLLRNGQRQTGHHQQSQGHVSKAQGAMVDPGEPPPQAKEDHRAIQEFPHQPPLQQSTLTVTAVSQDTTTSHG